jgi:hypothetical protein
VAFIAGPPGLWPVSFRNRRRQIEEAACVVDAVAANEADALARPCRRGCETVAAGGETNEPLGIRGSERGSAYPPVCDVRRTFLRRETMVKCGKPSCRCSRGVRHEPYWYFRYEEWDSATGVVRYRREYVPPGEVRRVRRRIQRARGDSARSRSILSFLWRSLR